MNVEQLLRDTFRRADSYPVSPDLFTRLRRSIEEDHAHRRRVRAVLAGVVAGLVIIVACLLVFAQVDDGHVSWPWWTLEALATAILIVLIVALGPLIRRFGAIFVTSVFIAHPSTGRHFLRVLDVAYYLVFAAFVLIETQVVPRDEWLTASGNAAHLQGLAGRVGGMLLLMGVLHAVTIALLPLLGVIFSSIWRQLSARELDASRVPHGEPTHQR